MEGIAESQIADNVDHGEVDPLNNIEWFTALAVLLKLIQKQLYIFRDSHLLPLHGAVAEGRGELATHAVMVLANSSEDGPFVQIR